jgi:hypothetical protein
VNATLAVGLGGFLGSIARYKLGGMVLHHTLGSRFPLSTPVRCSGAGGDQRRRERGGRPRGRVDRVEGRARLSLRRNIPARRS